MWEYMVPSNANYLSLVLLDVYLVRYVILSCVVQWLMHCFVGQKSNCSISSSWRRCYRYNGAKLW